MARLAIMSSLMRRLRVILSGPTLDPRRQPLAAERLRLKTISPCPLFKEEVTSSCPLTQPCLGDPEGRRKPLDAAFFADDSPKIFWADKYHFADAEKIFIPY